MQETEKAKIREIAWVLIKMGAFFVALAASVNFATIDPGSEYAKMAVIAPTMITFSFIGIMLETWELACIVFPRKTLEERVIDLEARVAKLEGRDRRCGS